jgi:SAM-dependent methyltransferase
MSRRVPRRLRLLERLAGRAPAPGPGGLTREHVTWAYRLLLDREPESDDVVTAKVRDLATTAELRRDIMSSAEFRRKNAEILQADPGTLGAAGAPAPPAAVDAGPRAGPPAAGAVPAAGRWPAWLLRARYAGRCNVCGRRGLFRIHPAARGNLRESLHCPRCGSISRDRFLAAVLAAWLGRPPILAHWPVDRSIVIREPSAYRGRAEALARKVDYRPFRYPEENLEKLRDADASLDHVITADVFEHVRLDELGFSEIHRVLKPGGYFFLQVPYSHGEPTRVLVQPDGERDIYLCPPEYHDEDTLVYRIYGRDLLPRLERLGFSVGYVRGQISRWGIPGMDMIVCRKAAPVAAPPRGPLRMEPASAPRTGRSARGEKS